MESPGPVPSPSMSSPSQAAPQGQQQPQAASKLQNNHPLGVPGNRRHWRRRGRAGCPVQKGQQRSELTESQEGSRPPKPRESALGPTPAQRHSLEKGQRATCNPKQWGGPIGSNKLYHPGLGHTAATLEVFMLGPGVGSGTRPQETLLSWLPSQCPLFREGICQSSAPGPGRGWGGTPAEQILCARAETRPHKGSEARARVSSHQGSTRVTHSLTRCVPRPRQWLERRSQHLGPKKPVGCGGVKAWRHENI